LVLPCAAAGFYGALFISMAAYAGLTAWCPGGEVVSGICTSQSANWLPSYIGAILAPVLVIGLGALAAPYFRGIVAWALFIVGAFIGLQMGYRHTPHLVVLAGLAGAAAAALITRKYGLSDRADR
jgi:hypothetical protein